jgi:2-phosphoglycerate kinase
MSEFLNCAWIYMIYRKEKEQKDRYYFKLKQLQEKRRRHRYLKLTRTPRAGKIVLSNNVWTTHNN